MSTDPANTNQERFQFAKPDKNGHPTFDWTLTREAISDTVKLIIPPFNTVPIIFVPGIMGSNLMSTMEGKLKDKPVWRLDGGTLWGLIAKDDPVNLAKMWSFEEPGRRQTLLHPDRVAVDSGGAVPNKKTGSISTPADYLKRGWGEVSQTSYHKFLLWLEEKMNPVSRNPATWEDFYYVAVSAAPQPGQTRPEPKLPKGIAMRMRELPLLIADNLRPTQPVMSDDLLARTKHFFPVYACGYNWLASNNLAADVLAKRIRTVIKEHNRGPFTCSQVILVTHSMGGLVARACSELKGMQSSIAGIVHGVMPDAGAAVAYRRCKVGMRDEDWKAAMVIGKNGREVTAVFAQAPGALQLLPSQNYPKGWLKFNAESVRVKPVPGTAPNELEEVLVVGPLPNGKNPCPYEDIYLRRDRWWGLVREEWLKPEKGVTFLWTDFVKAIKEAKEFHSKEKGVAGKYHPNTYVYYGDDSGKQASFESIHWDIQPGLQPSDDGTAPTAADVLRLPAQKIRTNGSNQLFVGGSKEYVTNAYGAGVLGGTVSSYDTSYWEMRCRKQDAKGDGTVPACSGAAPGKSSSNIKQQFALRGFGHEGSYLNPIAQITTLYAITKIATAAKLPT